MANAIATGSSIGESTKFSTPPLNQLLNQITNTKLERGYFMLWKTLALPILRGYKLERHLSGTKICSPMFTVSTIPSIETGDFGSQASGGASSATGERTFNPLYEVWVTADQLLLGWPYNSMTPEVAVQLMGHESAKSLWDAIHSLFGVQSRAEKDYLRQVFQQTVTIAFNV
ncbi:uncharacterized protein LOC120077182 [Benincasa hispida]|uniref:uncharacterized protein LOC120077182 n=1 Tax=Benincasa hispida TaxID=102211 RepID=UPI0018FF5ABC|nr:uncharacterized protein LOC120077182 [Benincasa hispida]